MYIMLNSPNVHDVRFNSPNVLQRQNMASRPYSTVNAVVGFMTIGNGAEQFPAGSLDEAVQILSIWKSYGHDKVGTSREYRGGYFEEYSG